MNKNVLGHLLSLFTVLLWGTTFVSTKILLIDFTPLEILIYRFVMGIIALILIYPKFLKGTTLKQELTFAMAGFCGVTMYYLLENIAMVYTLASNAALLASLAPFFTMILAYWFLKDEKLKVSFFAGFVISITGVGLICFNGSTVLKLNPLGDLLAIMAALVWAIYSILSKKISSYGFNTIQTTRRVFAYGLFFMMFTLLFLDFHWDPSLFLKPVNFFNLVFLGIGASALCFVIWNLALRQLGAIKTSFYIYLAPVITVIASVIILKEPITAMSGAGIVLTLLGLLVSKFDWKRKSFT